MTCTDPFPIVVSPTTVARSDSWRAIATTSAADEVFLFTRTTSGADVAMLLDVDLEMTAELVWTWTTAPMSLNRLTSPTA